MLRLAPLALILLVACTTAQSATQPATPAERPSPTQRSESDSPFKPYDEVITDEAVSDDGLFTVHRVDEDYFFEIPDSLLGAELLLVSRIAQTPANLSGFINGGSKVNEQVVRFERRANQLLLRRMAYSSVAPDSLPVAFSVAINNFEPIIMSFDIEALSPDSAGTVIEVGDLFESDVPALSGLSNSQRTRFRVRRLDGSRSFIDEAKSFPLNVNVRHTMTYEASDPPSNSDTGTISMQMYQSMVLLPERMMPRVHDHRVGYFTVRQLDFSLDELKAGTRSYIRRWRLEPSDPAAYLRGELVEPVKPIVYYLDPGTPERWRPYFCAGVEDWNRSFEAAGFRNAIRCHESPEDDPDWDPEDVRYSTVRYVANTTRNATGPSVSDPRTGEIIESDIIWYHNHMRSYRNRLMIETGAANPGARTLNTEESLIGETMRQVIAHEIGHALGLPHNMIASSSFPVDSLRSPTFTSEYGVAPTIMDYTRQNYIAQPGDGVTRFVRMVGPYDDYVINWGYRWYPGIEHPDQEKGALDALILEKAGDKRFRFLTSTAFTPDAQTEDMGDDPVRASGYAVANLKRVVPNLVDWTSTDGKAYDDLDEIYGELLGMWSRYMRHVVTVVGGRYVTPKTTDQEGPVYEVVPRDKQEAAMAFLDEHVWQTPTWVLDSDLLRRIEPAGAVDRMRAGQASILNNLLGPARIQMLIEAETIDREGYTALEFLDDLRNAIFAELNGNRPEVDTYRRALQRAYVERMEYLMTEEPSLPAFFFGTSVDVSQSDIRAMVRGQLRDLDALISARLPSTRDRTTRYHLQDVQARIADVLDAD
ncbi:MAG: zinc-dependent metalloprotease [Rhodothermales bacterium]|nr:zinc-dependent metalloprotease [Rhodothermales bacterium]MBO6778288.1 zinc-dependent metalloprotease [Rhodothermales bacterium]